MKLKISKDILLGIIITLTGSFFYVMMSAVSKVTSQHLITNQIIFLQSLSGFVCACFFLKLKKYDWRRLWYEHHFSYLSRIIMSLASIYTLIYGLQFISIFNALVVLNSAPLVIPLLRRIFFKKKIPLLILPATLIAFIGIVLILSPDRHLIERPIIIVVVSMLCMALSLIILEKTQSNDANLAIFYYFLYSSVIISALLYWQKSPVTAFSLTYVSLGILTGILFFFVQLAIIYAANYISSQLISVLFYAEIIMSLYYSILYEGVPFNRYIFLGTAMVIVGGMLVTLIENKAKQENSQIFKSC